MNSQKGFILPLLIAVIAVLAIGGGIYIYETKKVEVPASTDLQVEQSNQTLQSTVQNNSSNNSSAKISPDLFPVTRNSTEYIKDSPTQSSLYIVQPVINETWQIGTPHPIRWKLNIDQGALRGSLLLTVFLQDSSGNLISTQVGQKIQKDQNSTTISIPYFANPAIMPGNYHLVFNIYDTGPALPCGGCQGYSKLVASATTTAIVTLTASDGKVAPAILSLSATNGRVGDSISVNGVAFQNDSKIIFERLNPFDGQARIKISLTPQIVSSNKLTFTIPSGCTNSDVCNPQNSLVTSGVYYVSVQTQYGTSNVSGIQVSN